MEFTYELSNHQWVIKYGNRTVAIVPIPKGDSAIDAKITTDFVHLIVAAPAMLAACKLAWCRFQDLDVRLKNRRDLWTTDERDAIQATRKAIDMAEGIYD
jgi:hypothetical protein